MEFSIFTKSSSGVKKEVENYSFDVTYPNDTSNSSNNTNSQVYQVNEVPVTLEQTKSQAISFIRCLVEFSSTLDALPEDRWLTLKLKYFDHTPIDYEPLYFHSNTEKHLFGSHAGTLSSQPPCACRGKPNQPNPNPIPNRMCRVRVSL